MNKKKNKNNTKNKVAKETAVDYSSMDCAFEATIDLGNGITQTISFDLEKDDMNYDDLTDKIYGIMDKKFPEDAFPKAEIKGITVFCNETQEKCPVFAESEKDRIKEAKKNGKYSRYLVLPEYTYHLTPECKLWMALKDKGVLKDDDVFDTEKMKEILEITKKI